MAAEPCGLVGDGEEAGVEAIGGPFKMVTASFFPERRKLMQI